MKYIKIFEQFLSEAKAFGAKEIMKELKNKDDWGDLADQVYMRGGNMVFVDTWYYGAGKAMKQLEDSWKKGGSNYDYWNKEYGVDFKIVDTFSEIKAEGRHKKLTKDGIVGVVLKVTPGKISEAKDYQNKMDLKDFKKIKKGSKIQYMGIPVKVLDNSGYVLKLKGEDGKIFVVNKGQFDHGGRIAEGTYNSKDHIGSTSDGQGSNAEIYKKGKGYYVVVSGEADYDFDAKNDKELLKKLKDNEFDSTDILEVNEAEDYKYKKYVTKAFDKISDAMFEFRNAMGVKQLGQSDPKLKKRLELMQAEIFALRRDMKSDGLTEGTFIDLRIVNENVNDEIESALINWLNVLADGDPVKITDLYLEDGVLLGTVAEDIKQGHTAIQEYFDMFVTKNPIGSVNSFILQNFGDICISDGTYTFELDGEEGGRESVAARYTYVWKKINNKWMIATHHSSINPE